MQDLSPTLAGAGVCFAYLFGSRARGEERPDSDYDIAVWYPNGLDVYERFLQNCHLQEQLEKALGVRVDLVILNDAKPTLQNEAVLRGRPLFPDDKEAILRFEARIRLRYDDYRYSQRFFSQARAARLGRA